MKCYLQICFFKAAFGLSFLLCLSFNIAVFAQPGTINDSTQNTVAGPFAASIERRNREIALRSLPLAGRTGRPARSVSRAMLEQMNEDFKRLQIVRLGLVGVIKAGKSFEYKRLSTDAAEIRKRAARLRESLVLFDDGKRSTAEKAGFDKTDIQDAASMLCIEISRFTENPMFKPGGAYNVRNAAEAQRALDAVINLAARIKNSASRLRSSK